MVKCWRDGQSRFISSGDMMVDGGELMFDITGWFVVNYDGSFTVDWWFMMVNEDG